ncbi:hypothetical protein [Alkaliphilus peptidifermentans]|uniref:Uncharacterized protein n=1 Tax=Alkaliphilus peptidifermentans DSM 18978 TaxID=1120976 RepID=A0A1G5DUB9_9FIRM|nr:hypothetical protein [Alkaliphilus peptidifermentans]SCY18187.1 hypothetical protein SAMN03080606_01015 [Alkaliphilus peptidifermentans DSM 18978]
MTVETFIKNTPGLLIFIVVFGGLLKREYNSYNFEEEYWKINFFIDNHMLIGGCLVGVILLIFAVF